MENKESLKRLNELFGSYKAEWLKEKIFDFFSEPSYFITLKDNRPCVLQGGRGTGKTTVLKGLSYQGQFAIHKGSILDFDKNNFIGIYFKVNTNHVRAFTGCGLDEVEWQKLFGHYFNLIICREILFFMKWHKELSNNDDIISTTFSNRIAKSLRIDKPCDDFEVLLDEVESTMYEFQAKISNISDEKKINLSMPGDPIKLITESAVSLTQFRNKMFYILVDEYENFTEYQQRCINTFIKHITDLYTFKVGIKEQGWATRNTLNPQESLTDPADFVTIKIEDVFNNPIFKDFAENVCRQRIEQLFINEENDVFSIENALSSMSMNDEAIQLGINRMELMSRFDNLAVHNKHVVEELFPLYQFFLIYWSENYNISLEDIISDFKNDKIKWDERYENYKYSLLFKIRKGRGKVGIQKYYSGWKTYIKLANGNIRYLMELVYRAFEKHLMDNKKILEPISAKNQTLAAQETGLKNLKELEGLCRNGATLTKLLLSLGRIFNVLISENGRNAPEINQIDIIGDMSQDCKEIIKDAIMHLALIKIPGNKLDSENETKDYIYAMHPIYAPYFVFSHRKKRKMEISEGELLGLITDSKKYINNILKKKNINDKDINGLPEQLLLFKEFFENDK
jgi:hypothetical protein